MNYSSVSKIAFGLLLVGGLAACGGGGGGSSPATPATPATPAATTVTGTAATGKALAGATVTLRDSKGVSKTATTSASGKYTIDVTGLTPPFVVTVTGIQGSVSVTMVSVAAVVATSTTNIVNITPLTTVIAAKLSPTGNAVDLSPVNDATIITASLSAEVTFVETVMQTTLTDAGLAADANPITTAFDADGTGYDRIYDDLQVGQTSNGEIFLTPKCVLNFPGGGFGNRGCYTASNPNDQTTTNPNLCGFDIATGAGIPCDPSRSTTESPSVTLPAINGDGTVSIGGAGISFGPADKTPPPNPPNLIVPCTPGTSGCQGFPTTSTTPTAPSLPAGFPTNVPAGLYVISGNVCTTLVGCTTIPSQSVQNTDPTEFANAVVSAFRAGAASAASSGCAQSQTYTAFNGSFFSGTFTATCTSGGFSASTTVTLTVTKQ